MSTLSVNFCSLGPFCYFRVSAEIDPHQSALSVPAETLSVNHCRKWENSADLQPIISLQVCIHTVQMNFIQFPLLM